MRSDLVGMPMVSSSGLILIIRAVWVEGAATDGIFSILSEDEEGRLHKYRSGDVRMLVPQAIGSQSVSVLVELAPDLLMGFGRREIMKIWTYSLDFDGPLRKRIEYGIAAFKEAQEAELEAYRAERNAGYPDPIPTSICVIMVNTPEAKDAGYRMTHRIGLSYRERIDGNRILFVWPAPSEETIAEIVNYVKESQGGSFRRIFVPMSDGKIVEHPIGQGRDDG